MHFLIVVVDKPPPSVNQPVTRDRIVTTFTTYPPS